MAHFCCHSHVAPNFKSFYNCGRLPNLVEYVCIRGSQWKSFFNSDKGQSDKTSLMLWW